MLTALIILLLIAAVLVALGLPVFFSELGRLQKQHDERRLREWQNLPPDSKHE